jgi:AraC-like DNA-binding protein
VRYVETRPSADLAPYVQCVWELEAGGTALTEPIFPDGRLEIAIHLGDRPAMEDAAAPQAEAIAVGQMTAALRLRPVTRLHTVGIRFTPTGARAWLAAPVHELTDRVHDLDDVSREVARGVRDAVYGGITPRDRVHRIESALRATLWAARRAPRSVEYAVHLTLLRSGRVTVDALTHACGVSGRQLERHYLEVVGLSPKAFARTVRFQRALRHLRRGIPAAEAAAATGFADQSHLAREFRRFAGVPAGKIDLAHVAFLQDGPGLPEAD